MNRSRIPGTLAVLLLALSAPAYAGDLSWSNGQRLKWGSDYYYPDGNHILWGKDLYYPNGQHLRWGSDLYYPSGQHLRWGKSWYLPDGSEIDPYQSGRLVDLQEGDISVRVWRDRTGGPFSVSITLSSSDWYVEYHERGKIFGARLWALGTWHFLSGDSRSFRSSAAPSGFHVTISPSKGPYGKGGNTDFSLLGSSGSGTLGLCSSEYDTLFWEKSGDVVFFVDSRKKLWLVDTGTCHGGAVADRVESFVVRGDWLFYRQRSGKVWLLTEGNYYHLASGAQDLKVFKTRSSGWGISAKVSRKGWFSLRDFQVKDGIVRAYEDVPGRDIWLLPQETFTRGF